MSNHPRFALDQDGSLPTHRPRAPRTSLEEKLELLEERFTKPLSSPSEATLGPLSSPDHFPSNNNATSSQHSFTFDTPSLLGLQNGSNSQQSMMVRSKGSSWVAVSKAAAIHMAKVSSASNSSVVEDSNPTRLTSHVSKENRVVKESPPPPKTASTPPPPPKEAVVPSGGSHKKKQSSATKAAKRKSVPMKREVVSVRDPAPVKREPARDKKKKSTKRSRDTSAPLTPPNGSRDAHSRDRPAKTKKTAAAPAPPPNNASIYDFFKIAVKSKGSDQAGAAPTLPPPSSQEDRDQTRIEELERRCLELEQANLDKEEQLKAVSNNRTILHSALQSALHQREKELAELKEQNKTSMQARAAVMEELVREDAAREAKAVRDKLAVDGARLGRIVHTRAGLRSVETWEDGHASKHVRERRKELKDKRASLEARYQAALAAAKLVQENGNVEAAVSQQGDGERVGGILVKTKLEAVEAIYSVQWHMSNLAMQESELLADEQAIHDEKTAHIRALKRVASEDASRFRSRPKLHDRYVLRSLLGKGGFSEVWRAYDLHELREVAVKIHQLDPRWSDSKKENYTKHVSREYEIHRNVRHPRIVSLFDVFEIDNNSFATVLECCNGSDLDTLLKERRTLPEKDAKAILVQILLGMQYLSQPSADGSRQGIIHYDLKPGNILFDRNGDAKITDFGLSKIVDTIDSAESMELTSQGAGTYWYLPPECFVLDDTVRISNKVDVWSIGVIFFQMLFAKRPFGDGMSQDKLLSDQTMLNARQVHFPAKPIVSDACKDFIRTCLTYEQSERPTIAQLCNHPYVLTV